MPSNEKLKKYAELTVRVGVNIQPGQLLVIGAPIHSAEFVRLCVQAAYQAGAGRVQVLWRDEQLECIAYENEETARMMEVFPWEKQQKQDFIDQKYALLQLSSSTPGLLAHIDAKKLSNVGAARAHAFDPFDWYFGANHGQWSVVAAPCPGWAQKMFPGMDAQESLERLWDAVFTTVRIHDDNDPVVEWKAHALTLEKRASLLNDRRFTSLHFQNSLGTNLTVKLVKDHVWAGGSSTADNRALFMPNMPTEEVFTMPYKFGTEGRVVSSKPLSYRGRMIEDFWIEFHEGKAVSSGAKSGADLLQSLISFDAGSSYLGEVALVPHDSPISSSGLLFRSTLFDENASCHLALGDSYPENVCGGEKMERDQLDACGANHSVEHCDFMFGTADLCVTGIAANGARSAVMQDGSFVLE